MELTQRLQLAVTKDTWLNVAIISAIILLGVSLLGSSAKPISNPVIVDYEVSRISSTSITIPPTYETVSLVRTSQSLESQRSDDTLTEPAGKAQPELQFHLKPNSSLSTPSYQPNSTKTKEVFRDFSLTIKKTLSSALSVTDGTP